MAQQLLELLSSMRFAIALLTVICIASVIGTVLRQAEPYSNYVNQFGPFWAEVFGTLNLYAVYSAPWFLVILAFLVLSTSLCILRNAPKIVTDLRTCKENLREQSLRAFAQRAEATLAQPPEAEAHRLGQLLLRQGWKVKLQARALQPGEGWMVAGRIGGANKIGYLAAHSAIVLVCIGGLLDGDLMVRAQTWFNGKSVYSGGGLIKDVAPEHRLSDSNPTFRGNLLVPEGANAGTAILTQPSGILLQELPFSIELKKFHVDFYSTGMPKLFASDIVIHDKYTGEQIPKRVEVNHPASHRGIEIYQSSFDDGGSRLTLQAVPMARRIEPFEVTGRVGDSTTLSRGDEQLTLEFTALRVINVENFGAGRDDSTDVRAVNLRDAIESRLGAANKITSQRELRNVGPSVTYKLRDAAGQAREFHNYMLPVELDGLRVYLLGMRDTPTENFRYLRVPVDESDALDGFMRLRGALSDPRLRAEAVGRYVGQSVEAGRADLAGALTASAARALELFAGADPVLEELRPAAQTAPMGGLQAVSAFLEKNVPSAERERAGDVLVRILNGTLFELMQVARAADGLPPLPRGEATATFMTQAVLALSDSFFYPAPMAFTLKDFEQVQASVFQVARAPGKTIVYIGCFLLIVGVFAMLYVRERRVWIWLRPGAQGQAEATLAFSTNRRTVDGDREFERLRDQLLQVKP